MLCKLFSGGAIRSLSVRSYAKVSSKNAEVSVPNNFSDVNEEIANYVVDPLPPAIEHKETLKLSTQNLLNNYREFYNKVAGDPNKGPESDWSYHTGYYNLSEADRKAVDMLHEASLQAFEAVVSTHPEGLKRPLTRMKFARQVLEQPRKAPIRVAVTGAAGAIGYALLFRIASGDMFGPNQPVILHLLELPQAEKALEGVVMEIKDCAFPLIDGIVTGTDPERVFEGVDWALLVGAQPRKAGMERGDLLLKNAEIFSVQGKALDKVGKGSDTRVCVVGNPANTNAMIAQQNAPSIPPENFAAMMRLDHNRGLSQLASKLGCAPQSISKFVVWGNHSATQFPDIYHATLNGKLLTDLITDTKWVTDTFIPTVQKRGAAIIQARGSSSAASAAGALVDNIRDWYHGTLGQWSSVGVYSDGSYGVTEGLFYGFPVIYTDGFDWDIVHDLPITEAAAVRMEATHKELLEERDVLAKALSQNASKV